MIWNCDEEKVQKIGIKSYKLNCEIKPFSVSIFYAMCYRQIVISVLFSLKGSFVYLPLKTVSMGKHTEGVH